MIVDHQVGSTYVLRVTDPFAALLEKGELPTQNDDGETPPRTSRSRPASLPL